MSENNGKISILQKILKKKTPQTGTEQLTKVNTQRENFPRIQTDEKQTPTKTQIQQEINQKLYIEKSTLFLQTLKKKNPNNFFLQFYVWV